MALAAGCQDTVYRAGQPVGERYSKWFIAKFRDELLKGESFDRLWGAKMLVERWNRAQPAGSDLAVTSWFRFPLIVDNSSAGASVTNC